MRTFLLLEMMVVAALMLRCRGGVQSHPRPAMVDLLIPHDESTEPLRNFLGGSAYSCPNLSALNQTLLALLLGPTVFQADGAVEHQMAFGRVFIDAEVTDAVELVGIAHLGALGQERLDRGVVDDAQ